jgi:formate dehydrogenase major subunit
MAVGIEPWHRAPVNAGKLCQKGRYAYEFIHSKDRLVKPLVRKNGQLVEVSWEEALALIAEKFTTFLPEEIACLTSARTSNEENYLMQKFARLVLKTSNVDHCARLCHSSTVAGLASVFGSGAMTNSISDLEESKCIFIIGSNTLEQHPLIGRRVMLAKKKGAKIVCADPRYTPTAKQADLYLSMYSGTDVALLNGLMHHIIENGWEDSAFISKRTKNFEEMKTVVMQETYSLPNVSKITGVPEEELKTAAEWIAHSKPSSLLYSMGITQHTVGVDNVKSTANLMLLTGNLGSRRRSQPPTGTKQCAGSM